MTDLRDPSDIPLPPEYGNAEDVCEHGEWKADCKACFWDMHVDIFIDEKNDE